MERGTRTAIRKVHKKYYSQMLFTNIIHKHYSQTLFTNIIHKYYSQILYSAGELRRKLSEVNGIVQKERAGWNSIIALLFTFTRLLKSLI